MQTSYESLVQIPERANLSTSVITFDGLLHEPLKIHEDGGEAGCGGKLWPAGELLSRYLIRTGIGNAKKVLELGSGTGLVGLALALCNKHVPNLHVYITDQRSMLPLMEKNILLNDLSNVHAEVYEWGLAKPAFAEQVDLVLAADCVYLETAFPLLHQTLVDLTHSSDVPILMTYKKRRKADARFFKAIRKSFSVEEITNYHDYAVYRNQAVYLYILRRLRK